MECVGYDYDWYEQLVYSKAHPKPPKEKKDKKDGEASQITSKKRKAKGDTTNDRTKKRMKVDLALDSQVGGHSEESGSGSDASDDGPREITPPSSRVSARLSTKQKHARAISIEL